MMKKIKMHPMLGVGIVLVVLLLLLSIVGPMLIETDPYEMKIVEKLKAPSAEHPFGTDEFGRDILVRVLHGGRISLGIGLRVSLFSVALGLILGLYAGFYPVLDHLIMRVCDGLMAIPGILLAIALMSAFQPSAENVVLALTIVYTPGTARLVRASVLQIKKQIYIDAIRVQGATDTRIIWKHIMPNVLSVLVIQASYIFAGSVISEAALSFLGAGIPAPTPSWGNIVQSGKLVLRSAWWVTVFPSFAIIVSVFSLNLIGDGLRDLLNPQFATLQSKRKADRLFSEFKKKRATIYESDEVNHG